MIFDADVDAQGGAYATGVLVLMTSAAVAVTLVGAAASELAATSAFLLITLVFVYTTVVNVIERPDGVKIAAFFIAAIVVVSLVSRALRSTELRVDRSRARRDGGAFIDEAARGGESAHHRQPARRAARPSEYRCKERARSARTTTSRRTSRSSSSR